MSFTNKSHKSDSDYSSFSHPDYSSFSSPSGSFSSPLSFSSSTDTPESSVWERPDKVTSGWVGYNPKTKNFFDTVMSSIVVQGVQTSSAISVSLSCLKGYAVRKIIGRGSYGSIMTACKRVTDKVTTDCQYVVKVQFDKRDRAMSREIFNTEVSILTQLNEIFPDWDGVRIIDSCMTSSNNKIYVNGSSVEGSVIVMDKWDGDFTDIVIDKDNLSSILEQLSDQIYKLHSLGYVHWDLFRKNVLYRENGDVSITDFGMARHEDLPPYHTDYYYNKYYFNVYTAAMVTDELGLTAEILKNLEYKGIVDYIILYSIIRDVYPVIESKMLFMRYLEAYNQKGAEQFRSFIYKI